MNSVSNLFKKKKEKAFSSFFYLFIFCSSVSSHALEIPETLMHEGQRRDNWN